MAQRTRWMMNQVRRLVATSAIAVGTVWLGFSNFGVNSHSAIAQDEPDLNRPAAPAGEVDADAMAEELTRGIVHEAYAQPVVFNPEAGEVVLEAPPAPIEELPPEEKPEGEYVWWIPGYWSWDDEENRYVWVSGLWRVIPPGLEWTPGYWTQTDGGYQWVSGFWRSEEAEEVEYLPPPPASVEQGPAVDPPTPDDVWAPGTWVWTTSRYAWRPGHWVTARPGWVWVPARYAWTPFGFVFCEAHWDFALPRRGVLYAPIWFPRGYARVRTFRYAPRVVLDVDVFSTHLFCRPTRGAYFFGDYYAETHFRRGIYPSYAYHMSRYGCDPVYAYRRWEHVRAEPDWHERVRADYRYRRDHVEARPPHTVHAAQQLLATRPAPEVQNLLLATSLDRVAARPQSPFKVERVSVERRETYDRELRRMREVQETRREGEVKRSQELTQRRVESERLRLPSTLAASATNSPKGTPEGGPGTERERPGRGRPTRGLPPEWTPPPRPDAPKVALPKMETPKIANPKVTTPKNETPKANIPKLEPRKVETPKVGRPALDRPPVERPKVEREPPKATPRTNRDVAPPKPEPPKAGPPKPAPRRGGPERDRGATALEDARKVNQQAVEDAQRRVREQQEAARKRVEAARPPAAGRDRKPKDREKDKSP